MSFDDVAGDGHQDRSYPMNGHQVDLPEDLPMVEMISPEGGAIYPKVGRAGAGYLLVAALGSTSSPSVPSEILVLSPVRVSIQLTRITPPSGTAMTADLRQYLHLISTPGLSDSEPLTVEFLSNGDTHVASLPAGK